MLGALSAPGPRAALVATTRRSCARTSQIADRALADRRSQLAWHLAPSHAGMPRVPADRILVSWSCPRPRSTPVRLFPTPCACACCRPLRSALPPPRRSPAVAARSRACCACACGQADEGPRHGPRRPFAAAAFRPALLRRTARGPGTGATPTTPVFLCSPPSPRCALWGSKIYEAIANWRGGGE